MEAKYIKQGVKPLISFLVLLRAADIAFSTIEVPLGPNMAGQFALCWIIPWPTVAVDLEANMFPSCCMPNFDRFTVS